MRARFIRGQDPRKSMQLGIDPNVLEFLKELAEDDQMNPDSENYYLGYAIVYGEGFYNEKKQEGFREFIRTWPKYKYILDELGLDVEEPPSFEETIFIRKNPPK